MTKNEKTVTLKLKRIDVCDLLLAASIISLNSDAEKWDALHQRLKEQLDDFDGKSEKATSFDNGFIRYDTSDQTSEFVVCETANEMFCRISKIICFADLDGTFEVHDIFYNGKKVEYVGWQPGMHFEYRFVENNELAWEGWFEHWDH